MALDHSTGIGSAQAGWQIDGDRQWLTTELDVVINDAEISATAQLHEIYVKATRAQWDSERDLDWSHELAEDNPMAMPDASIPIANTDMWSRLTNREKATLRRELHGWHISQILHGERASQLCASKLMLSVSDPAVKNCAAVQALDEARHIDVYSRLLAKIGPHYPMSPSLSRLLFDVLENSDPDITALGMQILIEGLALSFFKSLQLYSQDKLVRSLLALVVRDEARHFACGQIALARRHREIDSRELARREDFVVQAFALLEDYLFADEIWEPAGLPRRECVGVARTSQTSITMRRVLFRQLVPAVRTIGLLGDKTKRTFEQMGVMDYAAFPSVEVGEVAP